MVDLNLQQDSKASRDIMILQRVYLSMELNLVELHLWAVQRRAIIKRGRAF